MPVDADAQFPYQWSSELQRELARLRNFVNVEFSRSGTVGNGEVIKVPWGTTDDWNILVAPIELGFGGPDPNEGDNASLAFTVNASPLGDKTGWQVSFRNKYRFGPTNEQVRESGGRVQYLMAAKRFK